MFLEELLKIKLFCKKKPFDSSFCLPELSSSKNVFLETGLNVVLEKQVLLTKFKFCQRKKVVFLCIFKKPQKAF